MNDEYIKRSDAIEVIRTCFAMLLRGLPTIDTEIGEAYDPDEVDALMDKYRALKKRICCIPPAAPDGKAYKWIRRRRSCASAKAGCTEVTDVLYCPNCGRDYELDAVKLMRIKYCCECGIRLEE